MKPRQHGSNTETGGTFINRIKPENGDSTTFYRHQFEAAQDGIMIIDVDTGDIVAVNLSFADMLGYEREAFIGNELWHFDLFNDNRSARLAYEKLLKKGRIRSEDLELKTIQGETIAVEFIGTVNQLNHKRFIQLNIRDITQRKRSERLENQLKQAQKMSAVSVLAGGIAHLINNNLSVVMGGLEMFDEGGLSADNREYYQMMRNATIDSARIIRELLSYAGGGEHNVEPVSLSKLVGENLSDFKSAIKSTISIEAEMPASLPFVRVDKSQIQLAIKAILSNASEAIENKGSIRIICKEQIMTTARAKSFAGMASGLFVSLQINDNGKGMDEASCARVFEPFFTTHFPGRGLSMAAVYGIVKNHGGWISIDSQLNRGTSVCLYLPVCRPREDVSMRSSVDLPLSKRVSSP